MHFTREPIIETIVTPREGYKLIVRSSKIETREEYLVEAVEIVSFGTAYFYRSTEKPKPFLLSISDYEVVETREAKLSLKTAGVEKGIKIGGGKKETVDESVIEEPLLEEEPRPEKKRERKRNRRRRRGEERVEETVAASEVADPYDTFIEVAQHPDHDRLVDEPNEPVIPPSHSLNMLLPPPPTLISDHFGRSIREEQELPLLETPQSYQERVEEILDDVTDD